MTHFGRSCTKGFLITRTPHSAPGPFARPGTGAASTRSSRARGQSSPRSLARRATAGGNCRPQDRRLRCACDDQPTCWLNCGHDKLIPSIVWQNLHPLLEDDAARFVVNLKGAENGTRPPAPGVRTLVPRMIDRILSAPDPNVEAAVAILEHTIERHPDRTAQSIAAVSAKLDGLSKGSLAQLKQHIRPLLDRILASGESQASHLATKLLAARLGLGSIDTTEVRRSLLSKDEPDPSRLQALEALVAFRDPGLLAALPEVLASASTDFGTRALAALGRVEDPRLADVILAEYPKLSPELQPLADRSGHAARGVGPQAAQYRPRWEVAQEHPRRQPPSQNSGEQRPRSAMGGGKSVRPYSRRAKPGAGEGRRRNEWVFARKHRRSNRRRARLQEPLRQCHTIHGEGRKLGPDITANGRASFEQLLSNVFDPSLVIGPAYQVVTVVTEDGRNLTGLIAEDNDQRIVLRLPGDARRGRAAQQHQLPATEQTLDDARRNRDRPHETDKSRIFSPFLHSTSTPPIPRQS